MFAVSGQITTGPAHREVSLEQIILPVLARVHSEVTQALCVKFAVSEQFCSISAVGLLVKINSSPQERMRSVFFFFLSPFLYPSIYIVIALLSLRKTAA